MVTITFNTVNVETGDIEFCSPLICVDKDPRVVYRCLDKIVSSFNSWRSLYPLYSHTEAPIRAVIISDGFPADFVNLPSSSLVAKAYIPVRIREAYNIPVTGAKSLVNYVSKCFIEVSKSKRR